jgi:hypothetical protein
MWVMRGKDAKADCASSREEGKEDPSKVFRRQISI